MTAQINIQLSCTQWRRHSRAHAVLPSEVPGVNCTSESVLVQNIGQYGRIPYLFKLIPSFTIFICLSIDVEFVSMKYFAQSKVGSEKTFGSRRSTLIWPEVFSAAIGLQISKDATKHLCNLWLLQISPKRSTLTCQSVHVDEQTSEPELTSDILQSILWSMVGFVVKHFIS